MMEETSPCRVRGSHRLTVLKWILRGCMLDVCMFYWKNILMPSERVGKLQVPETTNRLHFMK